MEKMTYKKIELENNHTLVLLDLSRKITQDAYVVIMKANIEIKIEKELFFDDHLPDFKFQDILAKLGDKLNEISSWLKTRNWCLKHWLKPFWITWDNMLQNQNSQENLF
jgi:hypothetical protein